MYDYIIPINYNTKKRELGKECYFSSFNQKFQKNSWLYCIK